MFSLKIMPHSQFSTIIIDFCTIVDSYTCQWARYHAFVYVQCQLLLNPCAATAIFKSSATPTHLIDNNDVQTKCCFCDSTFTIVLPQTYSVVAIKIEWRCMVCAVFQFLAEKSKKRKNAIVLKTRKRNGGNTLLECQKRKEEEKKRN